MIYYLPLAKKGSTLVRAGKDKVIDGKPLRTYIPTWSDETILKTADTLSNLPDDQPILIHLGKSNLIALDFDNELYNEALQLDDELIEDKQCKYITQSIGKTGGHFIYSYEDNLLTKYIGNPNGRKAYKLDVLYGNTLLFFTNKANTTKQQIVCEDNIGVMPIAVQSLIISYYAKNDNEYQVSKQQNNIVSHKAHLANIVKQAITNDEYMQTLLQIITPKHTKAIMAASRKELFPNHPDRLPDDESAHMYMVSLSGVFMLDASIDQNLHKSIMHKINSMFSQPLDKKRLDQIVNRDIRSDDYVYDSGWEDKSFIITNIYNEPLEVFMYTAKGQINYLVYNHLTYAINIYNGSAGVLDFLTSESKQKLNKNVLTQRSAHIKVINRPDEPFGYNHTNRTFNIYKWNKEQEAFYIPDDYKQSWSQEEQKQLYDINHPRFPKVTLAILEQAIGHNCHKLFLPFMARKYKTRDHSALFFVLFGVPHSFKSSIVNGIFTYLSAGRHRTMNVEVLTDKYNDWMVDQDLILIDEVHHLLKAETIKMIKTINEITGNKNIAGVRRMHQSVDSDVYPQEITFFLTTNAALQLTTEARDRRMVVFSNLKRIDTALNMSHSAIERAVRKESVDFAYYLSTEVQPLMDDRYLTNNDWKDDIYKIFQDNAQSTEDKIIKTIDDDNFVAFVDYISELNISKEDIKECMLIDDIRNIYKLRLINSKEDVATISAIFNKTNIDINKAKKMLQLVSHVKFNINDMEDGVYTGNKKIEWDIKVRDLVMVFSEIFKKPEISL